MRFKFYLFVTIALLCSQFSYAQTIKLGTLVPSGSPWHDILKEMGDRWKAASGGAVQLKIFAGGVAGDEPDMIRKLRIGQLQAAAVTSVGLGSIDKATEALQIPLAFSSYEELDYVRDRISGRLENILLQRGFVVLNWGDGGWVYFFVQKPTNRVADLKTMKLFTWAGDPAAVELWKESGFHPVPLATTDALPALQTGMINAYDTTAIFALSTQWFPFTKYMIDLKWAPLTGATIINKSTWEKIPEQHRPALLEAARDAGKKLREQIRGKEKEAIQAMVKRGLQVLPVSPEVENEWRQTAEKVYPKIRKDLVPTEYFDEVIRLRDEYRKTKS
ncbi:MAG TPA: TRAP transporter substrate-binding protein DctP [Acidobacteriota bacterium]|nr:TRAP transporter substrate-binding protein DctP [Acidobacteriota bacterium]